MRRSGTQRENVVVATKFGMDMQGANGPDWGVRGSRRYIRTAVEASLRRLGTDWIDLYQLHRPDPHTPIGETLAALDELVREGKVRYIGSSNLTGWQVVDADWTARARRHRALRLGAERVLPPRARRRGGARARVRARRRRAAAVLPARLGPADRASTAAASRRPRAPASRRWASASTRPTGTPSSASRGMPPSAVCASSTSPSAGSRPSPPWPRSSPGRPRPEQVRRQRAGRALAAQRLRPRRPRRDHPAALTAAE